MTDPFAVLGVDETAGDDEIRRRYLELVRRFPPDREPLPFQDIRSAYEALRTPRGRLEARLLGTGGPEDALARLTRACLQPTATGGRAAAATVAAILLETIGASAGAADRTR